MHAFISRTLESTVPILYRYIIWELSIPFSLSLLVLTFIMLLSELLNVAELLFEKGLGLLAFADVIGSMALYMVGFTLPLAFLVGILICFGRLSSDSEIVALRASGVSLFKISIPVFLMGLFLSMLSWYLHVDTLPRANWRSSRSLHEMARADPTSFLQEKVWLSGFGETWIYISNVGEEKKLKHVAIHQKLKDYALPRVITAEDAEYEYDEPNAAIRFILYNGHIEEPSKKHLKEFSIIEYGQYDIRVPITRSTHRDHQKKTYHLTGGELNERIRFTPKNQIDYRSLLHEKHSRLCLSAACVVFFLMGFPLSIQLGRGEKSTNFIIGALLALAWYLLLLLGKALSIGGGLTGITGDLAPQHHHGGSGCVPVHAGHEGVK